MAFVVWPFNGICSTNTFRLLNTAVYGHLFDQVSDEEVDMLRTMGRRWKEYEKQGKWEYQGKSQLQFHSRSSLSAHPFWSTGFSYWDLNNEAPDLFQYLSESDLVIFKGDLNFRKLSYDCHVPTEATFMQAIGPMATDPGAPPICSLRTIKSDVIAAIPEAVASRLDEEEPGWKISGKYALVLLSPGDKKKLHK